MAEYIDRAAAMTMPVLPKEHREHHTFNLDDAYEQGWDDAIKNLKNIPAADLVPVRHARWEECDYFEPCIHGFGTIRYANAGVKCTNCVHSFKKELLWRHNYCPNCGAKMDGGNCDD